MARKSYRRARPRPEPSKAETKPVPGALSPEEREFIKRQTVRENLLQLLHTPQPNTFTVPSIEEVRARYSLPVTMGAPESVREQLNLTFDNVGGFAQIQSSLIQHLSDLGQMPMASFLGYGALQNLAQEPLIRACVQTVADDLTRKWIEIIGGEEADAERVAKLDQLQKRYHLQTVFHDAAVMVGLYGGAFIFIDTGAEQEDLTYPLVINEDGWELRQAKRIAFRVVDPVNVTPCDYNCDNPLAGDYMQPRHWWVLGQKVHHSRLLALVENEPPTLLKPSYNFLGIPRAQLLADYVAHFKEARNHVIDLAKKISLLVFKTDTDQVFATPDGARMFDIKTSVLQRYRDNNAIAVCDKEREDIANVQTTIAGATDIVRQQLELVAAINRTPAVKILAISPSGFNATGESDLKNYYDHVRSQQELYRDALIKCLHAIELKHFNNIDATIDFEFVELAEDNASAKATNANMFAQTLVNLIQNQVISPEEARQAVSNYPDMGLDFLDGLPPDGPSTQMLGGAEGEDPVAAVLAQMQAKQDAPNTAPPAPVAQGHNDADKYNQAQIEADLREDKQDAAPEGAKSN